MYRGSIRVNDEFVASMISDFLKTIFIENQPSCYIINYDERDNIGDPSDKAGNAHRPNTSYIMFLLNQNETCEWSWSYIHSASPYEVMTLSRSFNYNV